MRTILKVVAIGSRGFVAGFKLAGIEGINVESPEQAYAKIQEEMGQQDVALILVSDDISKPIHERLTELRAQKPMPLVYEIPAPGSKREKVEYRDMLKSILGV